MYYIYLCGFPRGSWALVWRCNDSITPWTIRCSTIFSFNMLPTCAAMHIGLHYTFSQINIVCQSSNMCRSNNIICPTQCIVRFNISPQMCAWMHRSTCVKIPVQYMLAFQYVARSWAHVLWLWQYDCQCLQCVWLKFDQLLSTIHFEPPSSNNDRLGGWPYFERQCSCDFQQRASTGRGWSSRDDLFVPFSLASWVPPYPLR